MNLHILAEVRKYKSISPSNVIFATFITTRLKRKNSINTAMFVGRMFAFIVASMGKKVIRKSDKFFLPFLQQRKRKSVRC